MGEAHGIMSLDIIPPGAKAEWHMYHTMVRSTIIEKIFRQVVQYMAEANLILASPLRKRPLRNEVQCERYY